MKPETVGFILSVSIEFMETEEANTSAASFLDGDTLPKHGEKPDDWKSSGRRIKRGLFRTANELVHQCRL